MKSITCVQPLLNSRLKGYKISSAIKILPPDQWKRIVKSLSSKETLEKYNFAATIC